jgi:hypothetical protein
MIVYAAWYLTWVQEEMRRWVDELQSGGQRWVPIVDPGIPIQVRLLSRRRCQ